VQKRFGCFIHYNPFNYIGTVKILDFWQHSGKDVVLRKREMFERNTPKAQEKRGGQKICSGTRKKEREQFPNSGKSRRKKKRGKTGGGEKGEMLQKKSRVFRVIPGVHSDIRNVGGGRL